MNETALQLVEQLEHRADLLAERAESAMRQAEHDPKQIAVALAAATEGKDLVDACMRRMDRVGRQPRLVAAYDQAVYDVPKSILAPTLGHLSDRDGVFAKVLTAIAKLRANPPDTTEPVLGGRATS